MNLKIIKPLTRKQNRNRNKQQAELIKNLISDTNNCRTCLKAIEMNTVLEIERIKQEKELNEIHRLSEENQKLFIDRLGITELAYQDFIDYLQKKFKIPEHENAIMSRCFDVRFKQAEKLQKPIERS